MTPFSWTSSFVLLVLALLPGRSMAGNCRGLVTIKTDDPNLSFGEWQYREVTTCRFNPGCYCWDFLSGNGGFFPMTWFLYPQPSITVDGNTTLYDYEIERSCWASACWAKPDGINSFMEVTYSSLNGNLVIKPDASAGDTAAIRCGPQGVIVSPCTTCDVACEEALVDFTGREEVTVIVAWQAS